MDSYEKKYKDALARMELCARTGLKITPEYIFPELKESEDEKIRKELIDAIQGLWENDALPMPLSVKRKDNWLAWLGKQGKHANFRKKIQIGDKVTRNDNGELVNLSQLERVAKKLEKQEEQKPVEEYNITGIGSKNAQGKLGEMINNLNPVNEVLEQKPADKVEPKFKVGDWVVTSYGMVNQVIAVDEDGDGFTLDDDTYLSDSWKDNFHLWTIQDAKDGDVLATLDYILVFKEFLKNDGGISYCHYDFGAGNPQFIWLEDKNWYFGKEAIIHPATKEQRDLLFQKMKEAGYTFDFDKKELKKIQQTPAWSKEDDENIMMIENRFSDLLEYIREDSSLTKHRKNTLKEDVIGYFNWIKSLKERYVWKPSKEQMDALDSTLQYSQVSHNSFEQLNSLFNDLKKLKG